MDARLTLLAAAALLQLLAPLPVQSQLISITFGEADYQANENTGAVNVTLTTEGSTNIDITLEATPYTYEQYQTVFSRPIHERVRNRSINFDPAEFEIGGRQDFPRLTQEVLIPAGTTRGDFSVSIPVTDDSINEYDEGFLIVLEVSQETQNMAEAPTINLENDGVTLGIIANDDIIDFSFQRPTYTAEEEDGVLPDTVYVLKLNNNDTELNYTINVVAGGGTATQGMDYNFTTVSLDFPVDVFMLPVPLEILEDSLPEETEQFPLVLIRGDDNPEDLFNFSPNGRTLISINDDDEVVVGFENESITIPEGQGSVELCASIISPDPDELPDSAIVIANVYLESDTATMSEDFTGPSQAEPQFFVFSKFDPEVCITAMIEPDEDLEPTEVFRAVVDVNPSTPINTRVQPGSVGILDDDAPPVVDECAEGLDNCDENAVCIDLADGFTCECLPGFTGNGTVCEDIDECALGLDDCDENARCINTVGSYRCMCREGFTGDGRQCDDIDECAEGLDDCHENAECENTVGSFTCTCKPGYTGNGRKCEDIDECALGLHDCHRNARCINTPGSFRCRCRKSFVGNGRKCVRRPMPTQPPPRPDPSSEPTDPTQCEPVIIQLEPEEHDHTHRHTHSHTHAHTDTVHRHRHKHNHAHPHSHTSTRTHKSRHTDHDHTDEDHLHDDHDHTRTTTRKRRHTRTKTTKRTKTGTTETVLPQMDDPCVIVIPAEPVPETPHDHTHRHTHSHTHAHTDTVHRHRHKHNHAHPHNHTSTRTHKSRHTDHDHTDEDHLHDDHDHTRTTTPRG